MARWLPVEKPHVEGPTVRVPGRVKWMAYIGSSARQADRERIFAEAEAEWLEANRFR